MRLAEGFWCDNLALAHASLGNPPVACCAASGALRVPRHRLLHSKIPKSEFLQ